MKKVLITTVFKENMTDPHGIGGNWYNKSDTYMAWTCALDLEDRLSVTCPPIGLRFLKENVKDIEILEYPTIQEYCKKLTEEKWDMVGISFYTWSTPVAISMAKIAKEAGIKEIWGGNYGVLSPGLSGFFTRLITGAGEYALHEYVYGTPLRHIKHPVLMGISSFHKLHSGVGYLYSKRGCNMGCTFCSTPVFNPNEDKISIAEIKKVLDEYRDNNVAQVIIYDETFFRDRVFADRVVDALAERELPWIALTRADRIRGRIAELTDRYMDGAIIGIESLRDSNLSAISKRDHVDKIHETIAELNKYKRRAIGTYMIGFEEDTASSIETDILKLEQEDLFACQLTIFTPYHCTPLFKKMHNLIDEPDLGKFDLYHLVWNHPYIGKREIRELLAWAQKIVNNPIKIARTIKHGLKDVMMRKLMTRKNRPESVAMRDYNKNRIL